MTLRQTFFSPKSATSDHTPVIYGKDDHALILHPIHSSKARAEMDRAASSIPQIKVTIENPKFNELAGRAIVDGYLYTEKEIAPKIRDSGLFMAMIPGLIGSLYLALPCIAFWALVVWMQTPMD